MMQAGSEGGSREANVTRERLLLIILGVKLRDKLADVATDAQRQCIGSTVD
jgi:hypothetical protein